MLYNNTEPKFSGINVHRLQQQHCTYFTRGFCNFINNLIFIDMSFSIAISISDSKLFWVSEELGLVFNSLSLEKYLSHVCCVTLSVTMNLYAAY